MGKSVEEWAREGNNPVMLFWGCVILLTILLVQNMNKSNKKAEGYGASTPAGSMTQGYFAEGFRQPLGKMEGVAADNASATGQAASIGEKLQQEQAAALMNRLGCASGRDYSNQAWGWLDKTESGDGFRYRSEGVNNQDSAMVAAMGGL